MKRKIILGLFLTIFTIFLINSVSAIALDSDFKGGSKSAIITNGESINFNVDFGSMHPPMDISVILYDSSGNPIYPFLDTSIPDNTYANIYTISQSIYQTSGTFYIEVIATDSSNTDSSNTDSETLTLIVNPAPTPPTNNPPVITSTPTTEIDEEEAYSYQVTATDADADTLTYSLTQKPSWISINPSTGLIFGTAPHVSSDTNHQVKVKVYDGEDYDTQTYTLRIKNVIQPPTNNAPVIISNSVTQVNEGQSYTYDVDATDLDGDTLTYSLIQKPYWLSINSNTGLITGTAPHVSSDTNHQVKVKVYDGEDYDIQTYTLKVKNDEDEDEEDNDYPKKHTTSGTISSYHRIDHFYERMILDQYDSMTIGEARIISGLSESEEKQLSWFQKIINSIINFIKRLFGLN